MTPEEVILQKIMEIIQLAKAEEREECARLVEKSLRELNFCIAAEIRARWKTQ